jgi:hypothetical protein
LTLCRVCISIFKCDWNSRRRYGLKAVGATEIEVTRHRGVPVSLKTMSSLLPEKFVPLNRAPRQRGHGCDRRNRRNRRDGGHSRDGWHRRHRRHWPTARSAHERYSLAMCISKETTIKSSDVPTLIRESSTVANKSRWSTRSVEDDVVPQPAYGLPVAIKDRFHCLRLRSDQADRSQYYAREHGKCTETHIRPAIDRVSRVHFDRWLSLEPSLSSRVVGGGRYRTRTYDLVRVKQC